MKDIHYGLIGTGPIGCTIAAHLIKAGQRVSVLCLDSARAAALQKNPLTVSGALNCSVQMTELYSDLKSFLSAGPDVIVVAVKSCDTPSLLDNIQRLSPKPSTVYVSCQNGLDIERYYVERFGAKHALRIVLHIGAAMKSLTDVTVGFSHTHYLSDHMEVRSQIRHGLMQHLNSAGFRIQLTHDERTEIFKKAILNSSLGVVCAVTGDTMAQAVEDPLLRPLVARLLDESIRVAEAEGIRLGGGFKNEALAYMTLGGSHKPSILVDIEKKRRTENEDHCGRLYYYAQKHGIDAPMLQAFYVLVKKREESVMGVPS